MEKLKFMIQLKLIIFLIITIGALDIPLLGQKQSISNFNIISDFYSTLEKINDPYLLFLESLREYYSVTDSLTKLRFAEKALFYSANAGQFEISKKLADVFYNDNRLSLAFKNKLIIHLSDIYSLNRNGEEAYAYLNRLPLEFSRVDTILMRKSKSLVLLNQKTDALELLNNESIQEKYGKEAISSLRIKFSQLDFVPSRSPILSGLFSTILPGAGQIYSGHLFDGLNSFLFSTILGSASYASWKYQQTNKSFISIPLVSSIAFAFIYISNIWGGIESAQRYNDYQQGVLYDGILKSYDEITYQNR